MILAVFEDGSWRFFNPLTYTRPTFELMDSSGITLIRRIASSIPHSELYLYTRRYLTEIEARRSPHARINEVPSGDENILLVNGLARRLDILTRLMEKVGNKEFILMAGDRIFAAYMKASRLTLVESDDISSSLYRLMGELDTYSADRAALYNYAWELLDAEPELPRRDEKNYVEAEVLGDKSYVVVGEGSEIEPYVVIDTRRGPVIIGDDVKVESYTKLIGPCVIHNGSILFGGRIGPSVAAGPACRLGGEVEYTIILGHSNKRHYGFIGHSVIGEWVNLGAGTTNSNLKNTYGYVRVDIDGSRVSTGRQFFGCLIGDHVRTAIGTLISTGRKIGCFSMTLGRVLVDVPPFVAVGSEGVLYELRLESEITTAERMMSRRGIKLHEEYRKLIESIYRISEDDRRKLNLRKEGLR